MHTNKEDRIKAKNGVVQFTPKAFLYGSSGFSSLWPCSVSLFFLFSFFFLTKQPLKKINLDVTKVDVSLFVVSAVEKMLNRS